MARFLTNGKSKKRKPQIHKVGTNFVGCQKWYWENIFHSRDIKFKTFKGISLMIFMDYVAYCHYADLSERYFSFGLMPESVSLNFWKSK